MWKLTILLILVSSQVAMSQILSFTNSSMIQESDDSVKNDLTPIMLVFTFIWSLEAIILYKFVRRRIKEINLRAAEREEHEQSVNQLENQEVSVNQVKNEEQPVKQVVNMKRHNETQLLLP